MQCECLPLVEDVDIADLADLTAGYVGADLVHLCHEASYLAITASNTHKVGIINTMNPFTPKSSSRNIVCYFHTFENNLGMKRNFTKFLKQICCLSSDEHSSCFQENAFVREIFPKSSGLFWPL